MPNITIRQGGGPDVDDGVYPVILVEVNGPKRIFPANPPDNSPDGGVDILEWTFAIDDEAGDVTVKDSTSVATSPKSKMYGWLTALLGKAPEINATFDTDTLLGRRALATIGHRDGWPRVTQLTAMPVGGLQQSFARATGAPTRAATPPQQPQQGQRPARQQSVSGVSAPQPRPQPVTVPASASQGVPEDDLPF